MESDKAEEEAGKKKIAADAKAAEEKVESDQAAERYELRKTGKGLEHTKEECTTTLWQR